MKKEKTKIAGKILRWVLWIFLSVLALFILLGIFFTLPPGEKILRNIAEKQLRNITGQKVKIGKLETNLISRIQIRELEIFRRQNGTDISFVDLKYGRMYYSIFALLQKELSIRSLYLDSLQVQVIRDSSGFVNLPVSGAAADSSQTPADSSSGGFRVMLQEARLERSAVVYADRTIPLEGSLSRLGIEADRRQPGEYRFSLQADSGGVLYQQRAVPLRSLLAKGGWKSGELQLDSLDLKIPGLRLAGHARLNPGQSPAALSGKLSLTGELGPLAETFRERVPAQIYPLDARIDASLTFGGNLKEPRVNGIVRFPRLHSADLAVNRAVLKFDYRQKRLVLPEINIPVFDGRISGSGELQLDAGLQHQLSLKVQDMNFGKIWRTFYSDSSNFTGILGGSTKSSGPLKEPDRLRADARLSIQKARYQSKKIPDYRAVITVRQDRAQLELTQAESRTKGDVQLAGRRLDGRFSADVKNLTVFTRLFGYPDVRGKLQISGTVKGRRDAPVVRADLQADSVRYRNFPLDHLEGQVVYRDTVLHFRNLQFSGKVASIDSLNPPFQISGLSGGFSYQGQVNGRLDTLQLEFSMDLSRPAYRDFRFRSGSLKAVLNREEVRIKRFELEKDSVAVAVSGEYIFAKRRGSGQVDVFPPGGSPGLAAAVRPGSSLPAPDSMQSVPDFGRILVRFDLSDSTGWQIDAAGKKLDVRRVSLLYPGAPQVGGQMKFKLAFGGSFRRPNGSFNFAVRDARFNRVEIDSVAADMRVRRTRFYLDSLNFYLKGYKSYVRTRIDLVKAPNGGVTVSKESRIQGRAAGEDISLKLFEPFLGKEDRLQGLASFQLRWKGKLGAPSVRGDFSLDSGKVKIAPLKQPVDSLRAHLTLKDSLVKFEKLSGRIQKTPFSLNGQLVSENLKNFRPDLNLTVSGKKVLTSRGTVSPESMDLTVKISDFQLSPLGVFIPKVDGLQGLLNSDLSVGGSFDHPDLRGDLTVRQLTVQPAVIKEKLSGGVVKIHFKNKNISVVSLYFRIKKGSFYASGDLVLGNKSISEINMEAHGDSLNIEKPDVLKLNIKTTDLTYKTRDNVFHLEGDVILGESTLMYNLEPKEILSKFQTVEKPIREPPKIMRDTHLNVRLRESENIWIDNNLAHLRLHSELAVIGTLAEPNITGRLVVEEGYVLYLDRKFQVEKGVLDFVNPNKLNPIVNLSTQATVKDYQTLEGQEYTINLAITGPLDEANIELSSQPPLSRTDILSLLTFGATQQQLTGGGGSNVSQVLQQRLQSLGSGQITGYVSRKVGSLLGLEQMTIRGNVFNWGQASGPQLMATKQISDKVRLTYSTTVGHLNEQSIRLNYELTNHFSIQGQTNQRGRSGVDLKYQVKFK